MKNMKRATRQAIKWALYSTIIFILFILQTTPGLFAIGQARPVFLYTLVAGIAFFEQELPSAVFGVICGLLTDYSSARIFGFNGFFLVILAVGTSLLTKYLIRSNLVNFLAASFIFNFVLLNLDFFFAYFIWGYEGMGTIYLERTLGILLYSMMFAPLIYVAFKKIALKFNRPFEEFLDLSD